MRKVEHNPRAVHRYYEVAPECTQPTIRSRGASAIGVVAQVHGANEDNTERRKLLDATHVLAECVGAFDTVKDRNAPGFVVCL